jgi:hypothetical protein
VFEVSLSGVLTTTGTEDLGADAEPVAVSLVAETNVVVCGEPSNETTEPARKPVPFTVNVKLPVGIGDGLTDVIAGSGRIVTDAVPLAVGDAVLVARTVTVAGFGTTDGARY